MPPLLLELIDQINEHATAALELSEAILAESEEILKATGGSEQ